MQDYTLKMQLKLAAEPSAVYQALTNTQALTTWFAEHAAVDLSAAQYDFWGRYTPETPTQANGKHPIKTYEPDALLSYQWHVQMMDTTVNLRLRPRPADDANRGENTILTLRHESATTGQHQMGAYAMEDFWFFSLENLRRFLDGKPVDVRIDFSQPMTGDVHHSLEIDAPPEKVFPVLIQPDQVERWIASNATIEPRIGGTYDLGWQGVPAGKILDLQDNRKLSLSWGDDKTTTINPDGETVVTWTLEESNGKTRLTIVHSGFKPDADTDGIQAGWRNFMGWIRGIAEYGAAWQPPILAIRPGYEPYYAASIVRGQQALLPELSSPKA